MPGASPPTRAETGGVPSVERAGTLVNAKALAFRFPPLQLTEANLGRLRPKERSHRPQLLEHLAEVFPRHILIHYGQYQREQLFEAARRSRAAAYLADDDHGPLALQQIPLAGCPTVGVRTGASFVRHGETGIIMDRLPLGRQCAESDEDVRALAAFMEAIE